MQGATRIATVDLGEAGKGIRLCGIPLNCRPENMYELDEKSSTLCNGTNPGHHNGVLQPRILVALTDGKAYELGALSRGQGGQRVWDVCPTLREQMGDNLPAVIVLQDKCIGRKEKNTGNGLGVTEDGPCYTLTSTDVHAVLAPIMLENHPNDSRIKIDDSGNCQTLTGRMGTGGGATLLW